MLRATLEALEPAAESRLIAEVIVADGGSTDRTREIAREFAFVRVLSVPVGRAAQMNAGAAAAAGSSDVLCFLHADTRIAPEGWRELIETMDGAGASGPPPGGAFRFAVDSPSPLFRLIERGVAARCRWLRLPYGDQALFVRRSAFDDLGGFASLPALEDADFAMRLRRRGRLAILSAPATTSPRAWEKRGILMTAINVAFLAMFVLGVPPRWIAGFYPRCCRSARPPAEAVNSGGGRSAREAA